MPMTGPGLALLIERMVSALNARDIPSAGSMLEYFNKEVRRFRILHGSCHMCAFAHRDSAMIQSFV